MAYPAEGGEDVGGDGDAEEGDGDGVESFGRGRGGEVVAVVGCGGAVG